VLLLIDVDDHGHAAKVGHERVAVDQKRLEAFHEPQDVRLAGNVDPLRLGVQVDGDGKVDVAVDDELDCPQANVTKRNFTDGDIWRRTLEKDSVISLSKLNPDGLVEVALVPDD